MKIIYKLFFLALFSGNCLIHKNIIQSETLGDGSSRTEIRNFDGSLSRIIYTKDGEFPLALEAPVKFVKGKPGVMNLQGTWVAKASRKMAIMTGKVYYEDTFTYKITETGPDLYKVIIEKVSFSDLSEISNNVRYTETKVTESTLWEVSGDLIMEYPKNYKKIKSEKRQGPTKIEMQMAEFEPYTEPSGRAGNGGYYIRKIYKKQLKILPYYSYTGIVKNYNTQVSHQIFRQPGQSGFEKNAIYMDETISKASHKTPYDKSDKTKVYYFEINGYIAPIVRIGD